MSRLLFPFQFVLLMFSGLGQPASIGCDRVSPGREPPAKERLGGQRIRFTNAERRRLARRAFALGRKTRALANVGHEVGRSTIASIPREHGIKPAPERNRHTQWSTFLKAHWACLKATDFLSVEVHTLRGLITHYILFFIES